MTITDHVATPSTSTPAALAAWFTARPKLLLGLAIVAAACLGQLTALAKLQAVWTTGAFFDTDDAMRAVQVRDLAAGQAWFDMSQYRLAPPAGVFMHWSRVVDVPLLLLLKLFGSFADPATAERLARLAFPFLLTLAFFALVVRLCEILLGRDTRWPALMAAFLYGPATGQFEPGRIDHHAPQIVLLIVAITAFCHAVINERPRWTAAAGAAIALSMAISIENVPFFVPFLGALVLVWIFDAARATTLLRAFAAGLALAVPLVYAATIAPSRYLVVVGDALSLAQACALLGFAAFATVLTSLTRRLSDAWPARLAIATIGVAAMALALAVAFPELKASPFATLDPLVKTFWLDAVQEALPLARKFAQEPFAALALVAPALIGLCGAAYAAYAADGAKRQAWLLLFLVAAGGFTASLMMVRTLAAVLALGVPGALFVVSSIRDRTGTLAPALHGPFATVLLLLATSSVGWAAVCAKLVAASSLFADRSIQPTQSGSPAAFAASRTSPADFSRCSSPEALATLARLPPGLVLAEPDLGGYILAHTKHAVVAGAYHRNKTGLRLAIEALIAPPDVAQDAVMKTGADYLVSCRDAVDPQLVSAAADGLAVQLANNAPPTWLRHLAASDEPVHIYRVSKAHMTQK